MRSQDNNIECDSWEGETVDIIYDEGQWERAKTAVSEKRRVLGDEDIAARYYLYFLECRRSGQKKFWSKESFGALSYKAGSLSACKFVVGVLNIALDKGLNFQTETPVLNIARKPRTDAWIVETSRGKIEAKKVPYYLPRTDTVHICIRHCKVSLCP